MTEAHQQINDGLGEIKKLAYTQLLDPMDRIGEAVVSVEMNRGSVNFDDVGDDISLLKENLGKAYRIACDIELTWGSATKFPPEQSTP